MDHPSAITATMTYDCQTKKVTISNIVSAVPVVRVWAKVVASNNAPNPAPFPSEPYWNQQDINYGTVNGGIAEIDPPAGPWPGEGEDYTVICWLDYGEASIKGRPGFCEMGGGGGGAAK